MIGVTAAKRRRTPRVPVTAPATQTEQRRLRRAWLPTILDGTFDLAVEVDEICKPLAARVAAEPSPAMYVRFVDALADAVSGDLVHVVVGLITERDARRKTAHLAPEDRGRAIRALTDLAVRPSPPVIAHADLVSGHWATVLSEHVRPYAGPLADYLGVALAPDATRAAMSVSERLEDALREVDRAALTLSRRLDSVAAYRREAPVPVAVADNLRAQARADLAALGITP